MLDAFWCFEIKKTTLGISGDLTVGFQIRGSHWIHNFMACKFCSCRKDIQPFDSQLLVVFFVMGSVSNEGLIKLGKPFSSLIIMATLYRKK